jgi:hypothetical protein
MVSTRESKTMTIFIAILTVSAIAAISATVISTTRDGYSRTPSRRA